jgi:hypothetical protein
MRNMHFWHPTKFIYRNGKLKASRNPSDLGVGSRLLRDINVSSHISTFPHIALRRFAVEHSFKVAVFRTIGASSKVSFTLVFPGIFLLASMATTPHP